ncbi:hypothetical protein T12_8902, partial [Trichinella patagoniensis]
SQSATVTGVVVVVTESEGNRRGLTRAKRDRVTKLTLTSLKEGQ